MGVTNTSSHLLHVLRCPGLLQNAPTISWCISQPSISDVFTTIVYAIQKRDVVKAEGLDKRHALQRLFGQPLPPLLRAQSGGTS
jgi:hypothetical protein